jgi:DNA replication protein DnaC
MLVDAEWQSRANKRFARLLKKASLRYPTADIDKSIYLPERQLDTQTIEKLSTCHWIEEGKNLLVTGASASGKTFLVNALCITAMRQSKHVRYIRANTLMQEMEHARLMSEDMEYMKEIAKLDLLVIDDFGLMDLDIDRCLHLFEVLDTRDGRKSTTVISQFPVSSWFDMFADNTYADACLTRITDKHHTYRLEMNGISMRETDQL